jgi:hypothetical protein
MLFVRTDLFANSSYASVFKAEYQEVQSMVTITDDYMRHMISKTKPYSIVILKAGPNRNLPGVEKLIWEHGRRNFSLREDGILQTSRFL